jgi:putative membrane protein
MVTLLVQWILSALALLVVVRIAPGFHGTALVPALIVVLAIGLLNSAFEVIFKLISIPFSILTLGVILAVANGLILQVAGRLVAGFEVQGWLAAFWGALVLAMLGMVIHASTETA